MKETRVYFQFIQAKGHLPLIYINFSIGNIPFEFTRISNNYETLDAIEAHLHHVNSELTRYLIEQFKHIGHVNLVQLPICFNKVSKAKYKEILFSTNRL